MNRRQVLASVGCLTVGATSTAVAGMPAQSDDETDCEMIEIPTAKSGDEVVRTREVPEPWWNQVERARAVEDELWEEFGDEEWFDRVSRTLGDEEICGRTIFVVTVDAWDVEEARTHLEESRDGVRIRIEEATESAPLGGDGDDVIRDEIDDGNESKSEDETSSADDTEPEGDEPDDRANESTDETGDDGENGVDGSDDSLPGFGIGGAVAGLGAVGYHLSNRRHSGDES